MARPARQPTAMATETKSSCEHRGQAGPAKTTRHRERCRGAARRLASCRLGNDGDLRGLHFERLELAGASLRVFRRHRVPHDPHRRVVGHDPFGDPELAFRLFLVLSVPHRHVNGLAGVAQVNDELEWPDRACPWLH